MQTHPCSLEWPDPSSLLLPHPVEGVWGGCRRKGGGVRLCSAGAACALLSVCEPCVWLVLKCCEFRVVSAISRQLSACPYVPLLCKSFSQPLGSLCLPCPCLPSWCPWLSCSELLGSTGGTWDLCPLVGDGLPCRGQPSREEELVFLPLPHPQRSPHNVLGGVATRELPWTLLWLLLSGWHGCPGQPGHLAPSASTNWCETRLRMFVQVVVTSGFVFFCHCCKQI